MGPPRSTPVSLRSMVHRGRPPPGSLMSIEHQELIVREHERLACRLEAMLHIESPGVVLSGAAADAPDTISASVVDCSAGGAGLQTTAFLPRGCRLQLRVLPLDPPPLPTPGQPASVALALDAPVRIQRVAMISREPVYYLGTAFLDLDAAQRTMLARMLQHLRSAAKGGAGA